MYAQNFKPVSWLLVVAAAALGMVAAAGCKNPEFMGKGNTKPTPEQVARMPAQADVINVVGYYHAISPWVWTEDKSIADRVRTAIDMHRKKVSPGYVELPFGARDGGGK